MKTLYLIRHAKSSWSFNQLDDFSRPLGSRGRKDVLKMGSFLSKNEKCPEHMIVSPASRAFYTSLYLADKWGYPEDKIELEPALYHADEDEIIEIIQSAPDVNILAVFGHNPALTGLVNSLTNQYISNVPTCGAVGIQFDIVDWNEVENRTGSLHFFHFPKGIG